MDTQLKHIFQPPLGKVKFLKPNLGALRTFLAKTFGRKMEPKQGKVWSEGKCVMCFVSSF